MDTPDINQLRAAWITLRSGEVGQEQAGREFDACLNKEFAEVWDDGARAVNVYYIDYTAFERKFIDEIPVFPENPFVIPMGEDS